MTGPTNCRPPLGVFPRNRPRRLRQFPWTRRLVAENVLRPADLIQPLFVLDGDKRREPVASMPGVERRSIDLLLPVIERALERGIPAVALFPCTPPDRKSDDGGGSLERGQPTVPDDPRHQAPAARDRPDHRRRPRPLHQPRP